MKRVIALALMAALLLPVLCGCQKDGGKSESGGLRVGFARVEAMPDGSVSLSGYSNETQRVSTGFLDKLYTNCVAFSDAQDNTVLMLTVDIVSPANIGSTAREKISTATGVPKANIQVNASHTHSGPSTKNGVGAAAYAAKLIDKMVEAAKAAMEDRSAATLSTSSIDVEGLNFVKHYKLDNGTYAGDNHGDFSSGNIVDHAAPKDPEMRILKIDREGKKSVLLANWQAHAIVTGGINKMNMSGDFPASTRDAFESQVKDCYFVYLQGCAGDMNPKSYIASEEYPKDYKVYGQTLANYAVMAMKNMQPVEGDTVKFKQEIFTVNVDHSQDHLAVHASEVWRMFQADGNREAATALGKTYGFNSVYHAGMLISRPSMGPTIDVELGAIAIGDMAIITTPVEYFNQLGVYVRENSPYDMTFTLGYTNDKVGYMPSSPAYDYGCYEADITPFAKGSGELVADELVKMLKELKG